MQDCVVLLAVIDSLQLYITTFRTIEQDTLQRLDIARKPVNTCNQQKQDGVVANSSS